VRIGVMSLIKRIAIINFLSERVDNKPLKSVITTLFTVVLIILAACDYFDDPAIKACRSDLMKQLKSPSSYKEIEANLYSSRIGNMVTIKYDADNAFGAAIRGAHICNFIYFDGGFYFDFPDDNNNDVILNNISRMVNLSNQDLYRIPDKDTDLNPMFLDRSVDLCIKDALIMERNFPLTSKFKITHYDLKNNAIIIVIDSLEHYSKRSLPKRHQCKILKKGNDYEIMQK